MFDICHGQGLLEGDAAAKSMTHLSTYGTKRGNVGLDSSDQRERANAVRAVARGPASHYLTRTWRPLLGLTFPACRPADSRCGTAPLIRRGTREAAPTARARCSLYSDRKFEIPRSRDLAPENALLRGPLGPRRNVRMSLLATSARKLGFTGHTESTTYRLSAFGKHPSGQKTREPATLPVDEEDHCNAVLRECCGIPPIGAYRRGSRRQ
jgi:hypothetical protein